MKNFFIKIKEFYLRRKKLTVFLAIVGILIIGLAVSAAFSGGVKYEYTTAKAERGDILQTVSATGSVEANKEVNLNFKTTGKLFQNNVAVGDKVEENQAVAELNSRDQLLAVEKARSNLALATANLNLKITGESDESIKVYEEDVKKAEANYEKAKVDLGNTVSGNRETIRQKELDVSKYESAYDNAKESYELDLANAYDDARVTLSGNMLASLTAIEETDNILGVDHKTVNDSFEDYLGAQNPQTKTDAINTYGEVSAEKDTISAFIGSLNSKSAYTEIDSAILSMENFLDSVDNLLYKVRTLLDNTITGSGFSSSDLSAKKTTISGERTNINTEETALGTDKQAISSAKIDGKTATDTALNNFAAAEAALDKAKVDADNSYKAAVAQVDIMKAAFDSAEASLNLKKAVPRNIDLAALQAQVGEARASLSLAEEDLENTKLLSPFAGVVTAVNYEAGEQINLTTPVAVILAENNFKIKVDISESDIPKVSVGDAAEITFDAFQAERRFSGSVVAIDPAQTLIQDVVYYKVEVAILNPAEDIKPGMTSNIEIMTDKRDGVIYIPARAVIKKNGSYIVQLLVRGESREVSVTTGLYADDGLVEIIDGIKEGDEVITFTREIK